MNRDGRQGKQTGWAVETPTRLRGPCRGERRRGFVTWRAIALGGALIPLNAYWLSWNVWYRDQLTGGISLYSTAVFIVAALVAGNMIVKRLWPGRELSPGELLVAYVMVAIATSMGTTTWDGMTSLPTILTYPFRFATPANRWAERMLPILPQWAMVSDPAVVTGFWEGRMSPYSREGLAAWWRPALWWTAFLVTMVWVGLCLCSLVRRRWSEEERLAFPMTILPLAMTSRDGSLWRSRGFQWGAAVTSAVALLNLAHSLVPSVPGIPFGFYHGQYTVHLSPWSGIRQPYFWYPPFLIGISYLMPLDLLFSLWVFTVIGKLQQVAAIQLGWNTQTWWGPPYIDAQIWGALFAIMATVFWLERRYLWAVVRGAVSPRSFPADQGEAMSHRAALAGVVLGSVYLCVFLTRIGVEPAPACGFVALLLSVSLALARLRAQLGPPHHELPGQDAVYYWITRLGPNARTQAGFTLLGSYTMSYRDSPTAITVEGLKMGERERSLRGLGAPIVLAAAIGCLSLFWANIQLHYTNGADNNGGSWKTPPGVRPQPLRVAGRSHRGSGGRDRLVAATCHGRRRGSLCRADVGQAQLPELPPPPGGAAALDRRRDRG